MKLVFETKQFLLREIEEDDANDLFELDSNPEVHRFLGNNPVKTIQESLDAIKFIREQYKKYGMGRLAVIDKKTNAFVGWSGLKYETNVRKEFNYYDIGYRLKQKFWGNGIATETAIASLDYGFNTLNLDKICAAADEGNIASNTVLKKIGLKPSGTFIYEGEIENWYELTKEEWLKK
jgi:ribosomal-protein-alanine N-acetyltransferase